MENLSYPRYFLALFILFTLILAGLSSLTHGPKPKNADIPLDQFSSERAFVHLVDLIGDDRPHASASVKNKENLDIIVSKFKALGFVPEVQKALSCTLHYPGCTQVQNFIAVLEGSGSGGAIMLTTHYDSVPAGPGAGDAGAGVVALIEIARILKAESASKNDVIFLITDGEEGGLRGAQAFASDHPLMKNVKLMINLESRGASGPSSMFETSDGNRTLIKHYAKATKRPAANSLSFEIYKRLPNDTDYSIYKPMGVAGLNYAFTGDVALYHSARDDLEHLDQASLQHHGDNALGAVRAFRDIELSTLHSDTNATYFDVFGRFLLNWSSGLNIPLALFAILVLAFATFKARLTWRAGITSIGLVLSVVLLTPALGWLLSFPLGRWPQLFYLDHPYPWFGRLSLLFAAGLASWAVVKLFGRYKAISYNALASTVGILFAVLALAVAIIMPGASYIFLVPALAMTIGVIVDISRKHERYIWAAHLGLLAACYMAFYHFIAIEVILHYKLSHFRVLPLILMGLALLPILYRAHVNARQTYKFLGAGLISIVAATAIISIFLPGFNETHPRGQNLVYIQNNENGSAQWVSETAGGQDLEFLKATGFENAEKIKPFYKLTGGHSVSKPTNSLNIPAAEYKVLSNTIGSDGLRTVVLEVTSSNQGYELTLAFLENSVPDTITVNGKLAADYRNKPYWRPFNLRGPGATIYKIELTGAADTFKEMAIADTFSLTHDQLQGMAELRPNDSDQLHGGDRAHIVAQIDFQ
ncbi:MAG: M20/M25/M40 family metallo-hydrolase [Robiginitomaculum sp.]|nr:M20/M25/M40 family metallo-hydrolase [Robiginitomaculum sp.]